MLEAVGNLYFKLGVNTLTVVRMSFFSNLVTSFLTVAVVAVVGFGLNLAGYSWGSIEWQPVHTVTVIGVADTQQDNQKASFTAGVNAVHDDKNVAVDEVNAKVTDLIAAVKAFGIEDKDIKTQSISIYRNEDRVYEEGLERTQPGQWRVDNSIEIVLHNVDQASALADILTDSGATNVWGPNITVDDTSEVRESLLAEAIEHAQTKAQKIAQASDRRLGKVVSVTEGFANAGVNLEFAYARMGGGGGAPVEPGSSTVSQQVTVVFELK